MAELINKKFVASVIPKRADDSYKYTFGKVLNISGSKKYTGAAILSSIATLKAGAGYVTLASVDDVISAAKLYTPEITYQILNSNENGAISDNNIIDKLNSYNVISIGCGITTDESVKQFLFSVLEEISDNQSIIIDADAINILAEEKKEIALKNSIITPHSMELSRLLNVNIEEINNNREKYARITSEKYECITVLKGNKTIITNGEKVFINTTGNSALAKAGTGDVLTGIISAFAAQGTDLLNSAIAGVFIHGLSGDIASEDMTKYCVLASDLIDYLPEAFFEVLNGE